MSITLQRESGGQVALCLACAAMTHRPSCERANAVLAAAGYNFRLLLPWLALFLRALLQLILFFPPRADRTIPATKTPEPASRRVLHERLEVHR